MSFARPGCRRTRPIGPTGGGLRARRPSRARLARTPAARDRARVLRRDKHRSRPGPPASP